MDWFVIGCLLVAAIALTIAWLLWELRKDRVDRQLYFPTVPSSKYRPRQRDSHE
jgi:hypothetical protein